MNIGKRLQIMRIVTFILGIIEVIFLEFYLILIHNGNSMNLYFGVMIGNMHKDSNSINLGNETFQEEMTRNI